MPDESASQSALHGQSSNLIERRRFPRIFWIVNAASLLVMGATVFYFWSEYRQTQMLAAEVQFLHGSIAVESRTPQWLLEWAREHEAERYLEWLRTDVVHIAVSSDAIDDHWLNRLRRYRNLFVLNLKGTKITDAGLASVSSLRGLRVLILDESQVSDAGLSSLSGLSNLTHLSLAKDNITDVGVAALKPLPKLKHLRLDETRITDGCLRDLSDIPVLETVELFDTQVTPDAARRFQKEQNKVVVQGP